MFGEGLFGPRRATNGLPRLPGLGEGGPGLPQGYMWGPNGQPMTVDQYRASMSQPIEHPLQGLAMLVDAFNVGTRNNPRNYFPSTQRAGMQFSSPIFRNRGGTGGLY